MYMILMACTYGIPFGCAAAVCRGSFRLQTLVSSALMLTSMYLSRKLFTSKFFSARYAHGPVSHVVLAGDMPDTWGNFHRVLDPPSHPTTLHRDGRLSSVSSTCVIRFAAY